MYNDYVKQRRETDSVRPGLVSVMLNRLSEYFAQDHPEDELIDYFVDIVEPKLRKVRGYRKRLQKPLEICRKHCKAMVAEIPGPVYLKHGLAGDHPVIRAAFNGSERIEELLKRMEKTESESSLPGARRVALLTMHSREKKIFGRKMKGALILGDAQMRTITFSQHNVVGLAATLEESMQALEKYSLEIIAEAAARELSQARTRLVDLRERHEQLRAMHKIFGKGGGGGMGSVFVPYDPEKQKKQKKLEKMLMETESEIAAARNESETPKGWLSIIEEFLSKPEDILCMNRVKLRLDWRNVLTDDPEESASTITLAVFTLADEMQREGVLIAYEQD